MINDKLKCIFVEVPKTGSTSVKYNWQSRDHIKVYLKLNLWLVRKDLKVISSLVVKSMG